MAILHLFIPFDYANANQPLLLAVLDEIEANGATPMIDLACQSVDQINSGIWDGTIQTLARTLAQYGKPMFLRWYWEMNLRNPNCVSHDYPNRVSNFVSAWRRLYRIVRTAAPSASNVAIVWCPLVETGNLDDYKYYYPGDLYVDWIGGDLFYRRYVPSPLSNKISDWYNEYYTNYLLMDRRPKPLLIAATGATPLRQAQFFQDIQRRLPTTYQGIKAVIYFDAPGLKNPTGQSLVLLGNGLAAFRAMAASTYFSYVDTAADSTRPAGR